MLRQILQKFVKLGDRKILLSRNLYLNSLSVVFACSFNGPLDGSLTQQKGEKTQQTVACLLHYCHSCSYHNCKRLWNEQKQQGGVEGKYFSCLLADFVLTILSWKYLVSSVYPFYLHLWRTILAWRKDFIFLKTSQLWNFCFVIQK